jgi:hypothetical protein
MPKPTYKISNYLLHGLKWEVEKKLNYRINTKLDCRKISSLIQDKAGKTVSESTLYRLFLWAENQNTPYLHTLDIIAEYLDFKDWFSLEKHINDLAQFQSLYGVLPNEQQYKSLLSINFEQGSFKPLYSFLEQFPTDLTFEKKALLGEEIYKTLLTSKSDNLEFYKQFHTLPIVREGFFEIFADPDFQINNYEIGLNFYLRQIAPYHSSKTLQDFLFANSLLLRYYFIKGNKDKVLEIGRQLYLDLNLDDKDLKELYIFPKIRYYAYRLFYDFTINGFNYNYWDWLIDFSLEEAKSNKNIDEKRIIIHTILDVLNINPQLQEKVYSDLNLVFPEIFNLLPSYFFKLTMKDRVKYLNGNGSRFFNGKTF